MANTFPAHEFVCGGCRHVPGPPPGHTLVILAVAVLAITACGIGLTRSFGEASRPVATWDAPALAAPTNSTYCGLMGPYLAVLPEPDAAQFFARVCVEPAFISIV